MSTMAWKHPDYRSARKQLISFLESEGFKVHPYEVYCPDPRHCWVDVAALKGQDFWAFEYKSRSDSMRRGLAQCHSYSNAFNYVVLVADRNRTTSSPYFGRFKRNGFGVWSHTLVGFHSIVEPARRTIARRSRSVIERQFRCVALVEDLPVDRKISEWFSFGPSPPSEASGASVPIQLLLDPLLH